MDLPNESNVTSSNDAEVKTEEITPKRRGRKKVDDKGVEVPYTPTPERKTTRITAVNTRRGVYVEDDSDSELNFSKGEQDAGK